MTTSVFEQVPSDEWLTHNALTFAIRDAHPVSPGHTLVIPKRPIVSWFDATVAEVAAMAELVSAVKEHLDEAHHPDGYNVGFNDGAAAGQTVFHAHVHVIPRFVGDVASPAGGVRHALVGRGATVHTIHFHRKHHEAMMTGEKVTTVRWNESVPVGSAVFVFDEHPTAEAVAGTVTAVRQYRLDTLTAEQAHQPPGTDMHRFAQQLRENYYPDIPSDAVVEVAELTITPSR